MKGSNVTVYEWRPPFLFQKSRKSSNIFIGAMKMEWAVFLDGVPAFSQMDLLFHPISCTLR